MMEARLLIFLVLLSVLTLVSVVFLMLIVVIVIKALSVTVMFAVTVGLALTLLVLAITIAAAATSVPAVTAALRVSTGTVRVVRVVCQPTLTVLVGVLVVQDLHACINPMEHINAFSVPAFLTATIAVPVHSRIVRMRASRIVIGIVVVRCV